MPGLSRRMFLTRGSLAVAAAGVVSAIPGLPVLVSSTEASAPEAGFAGAAGGDASALTETLVAHVKDLQSGEISLYMGEREVIYHDVNLAALIHRAAR